MADHSALADFIVEAFHHKKFPSEEKWTPFWRQGTSALYGELAVVREAWWRQSDGGLNIAMFLQFDSEQRKAHLLLIVKRKTINGETTIECSSRGVQLGERSGDEDDLRDFIHGAVRAKLILDSLLMDDTRAKTLQGLIEFCDAIRELRVLRTNSNCAATDNARQLEADYTINSISDLVKHIYTGYPGNMNMLFSDS